MKISVAGENLYTVQQKRKNNITPFEYRYGDNATLSTDSSHLLNLKTTKFIGTVVSLIKT